jgi:Protein of unknown function (DUF2752)
MTGRLPDCVNRAQFLSWLSQPHKASSRWIGTPCVVAAWLGLLLAVLSPPHGSGVTVCWLKFTTGISCPGCGMTRSLSCGIRGMFSESWHYHPLGLVVLALLLLIAAQSLCPRSFRDRLARYIQNRASLFNRLYLAFAVTFVGFGIVRALFQFGESYLASR